MLFVFAQGRIRLFTEKKFSLRWPFLFPWEITTTCLVW